MAEIDLTFYNGEDQYSDGDEAEETLLKIVRENKSIYDLDQMSWPTFYHLNPVRENICNWYPFEPGSRVLEIGAGCGAVTGALCGRGLQVYSADLSLRRSTINFERHRNAENLHLIVGNLNDMTFPEPFDYILLIGVLEYAGRFTEGKEPYRLFLENIRRWLKPDGKLLIAIENRIGLKYFAGAAEDHLGIAFTGLKDYPENRGIRTFSRCELKRLLQKSGYQGCRFYYPYPDYKFPQEIFTDMSLRFRHYGKPYQVFDQERADIFPETEMSKTLQSEGVAGAFANSFLAETSIDADALNPLQVYYAKLNGERKEAFRTGIKIYGSGEPRLVSRYAFTEAADKHIADIAENERRLAKERNVLQGSQDGPEILYSCLSAKTLEDELLEAETEQDQETVLRVFEQIRTLTEVKPARRSYDTEQFTEWFGKERIDEQKPVCTTIANVNLRPENIFRDQGQLIISDCEWVADFAVPVSFLTWRSAEKTYELNPRLQSILPKEELWKKLEIPEENIPIYREWSEHFENRYISEKSLSCHAKAWELTNFTPMTEKAKDAELIKQKALIEQQKRDKDQLSRELEEILSSRSWRMTAGFRKARQKIAGAEKKAKS